MRWLVSRGWHGWALVLAVVFAFDVAAARYGGEPMSLAMRRWFSNGGLARIAVAAVLALVVAHLTVLPARYDPIDRAYLWYKERTQPEFKNPVPGEFPPGKG